MFNSKKIKELEGRISALERQISSFLTHIVFKAQTRAQKYPTRR